MPQRGDMSAPNHHAARSLVMARNGLIATSHPLASADGLRVLREGGNAVDAAVTAAATLAVVEPTMTGIGGDMFALLWDGQTETVHALNASGRAPGAASLEAVATLGMPPVGILSASVPGAVDGWQELLRHHGTVSFARALAPAIKHARVGFTVTDVVASQWRDAEELLAGDPAAAATFLPSGRAPRAGETFTNPRLGATLEQLATQGRDAFYQGAIGQVIAADAHARGGWLREGDLAAHRSEWVEPLRTSFHGHEVLELPPNTQGVTALEMLNLLETDDLASLGHNTAAYVHLLVEATRIAFEDRDAYVADPAAVPADVLERLMSKEYAARRRREITPTHAHAAHHPLRADSEPRPARSERGDTVYLAAADGAGNAVSFIQSLFGAFGSGIVAGDTGIVLQNRASLFSVEPSHPNCLAPHKRPFHTLAPALVLKEGVPWLAFGVMGGDMQPQGHVQVLANLLLFGMDVQEAGAAARVRWTGEGVALEAGIPAETRDGLVACGHHIVDTVSGFGGFQGVRLEAASGTLMGGSDPRKDGLAMGF